MIEATIHCACLILTTGDCGWHWQLSVSLFPIDLSIFLGMCVFTASVVYTYITNGNETIIDDNTQQPPLLEFVEYEPTTLRCMTHGGYPPPDILMYLGEHDVTQEMALEMRTQLTGEPGMRLITSTIELSSHRWDVAFLLRYNQTLLVWGGNAKYIITIL